MAMGTGRYLGYQWSAHEEHRFSRKSEAAFLVRKAAKQGKKTLDKIEKDMAGVGGPHPFPNLTEYGAVHTLLRYLYLGARHLGYR